jgi:hypothetical protein
MHKNTKEEYIINGSREELYCSTRHHISFNMIAQ